MKEQGVRAFKGTSGHPLTILNPNLTLLTPFRPLGGAAHLNPPSILSMGVLCSTWIHHGQVG